jgi:hypothetical protein
MIETATQARTSGFSEVDNIQDYSTYRSVSRKAAFSVLMLLLSIWGIFSPIMLAFALGGIALAIFGWIEIRRYPDEFSGIGYVRAGLVLHSLLLFGGISTASYVYATEVPDGYLRITFKALQPKAEEQDKFPPDSAMALDGQKIFVKGYVHPAGVSGSGYVRKFVLVPDMKTCCFGGQPAYSDMIQVTLPQDKPIKYNTRKRKLIGVLHVSTAMKQVAEIEGVFYELTADNVK